MDRSSNYLMNSSEYKIYHESFMQNNTGSTPCHTFFAVFFTVLCTLNCILGRSCKDSYTQEYVTIILPLTLVHTLCADYIYFAIIALSALLGVRFVNIYSSVEVSKSLKEFNTFQTNHLVTISCLRSLTYLITVFCILAVDFTIFPRYLAKTEQYGYSLMDTGVGLFVLMSGLVHKDYYNKTEAILKDNFKLISVLVVLGVSRFVSLRQLEYQEHVTEYGVHWNFFITLAVTKLFSTLLLYITDNKNIILVLSLFICLLQETLLYIGLADWVFGGVSRDTLLNANREGITSSLGYIALYLIGVHLKKVICDGNVLRYKVLLHLAFASVLSWMLVAVLDLYHKPASRTLANAGYYVYVVAILVTIICILYFIEVILNDSKVMYKLPNILSVINYNGLLYFLVANLLTGAVNFCMRTLFVNNYVAVVIINIYMITTSTIAVFIQKKGIHL